MLSAIRQKTAPRVKLQRRYVHGGLLRRAQAVKSMIRDVGQELIAKLAQLTKTDRSTKVLLEERFDSEVQVVGRHIEQ